MKFVRCVPAALAVCSLAGRTYVEYGVGDNPASLADEVAGENGALEEQLTQESFASDVVQSRDDWKLCKIGDGVVPIKSSSSAKSSLVDTFKMEVPDAKAVAKAKAEAEFAKLLEGWTKPVGCGPNEGEVIVYNAAIGSLFNDESRRSSSLKAKLEKETVCKKENIAKHLANSRPALYDLAMIKGGFTRLWTYPSGAPWYIWAVSLHEDKSSKDHILVGLTKSDKDQFVLLRPREQDYEVLTIPAEHAILLDDKPVTTKHNKCDHVVIYAYGYKKPLASPTEIFAVDTMKEQWGALKNFSQPGHVAGLCGQFKKSDKTCTSKLAPARGHLLAQSYIDVILSGLFQKGKEVKGPDGFQVFGTIDSIPQNHADVAKAFVTGTRWPLDDIQKGKILYVNDRHCPRNPNPLFTPREELAPPHKAGTSSASAHIEKTWQLIDSLLPKDLVAARIGNNDKALNSDVCKHMAVLPRWTDTAFDSGQTVWQRAYHASRGAPSPSIPHEDPTVKHTEPRSIF